MTIRRNATILLACATLAACLANSAIRRSQQFLEEGYLDHAFAEVDRERELQLADGGRVDPELEAIWADLRLRHLVEKGRQLIYADRELEGIAILELALDASPGDAQALSLIQRAQLKLAKHASKEGSDLLMKREFEKAVVAFRRAQSFQPGYEPAIEGEKAVREAVSRLHAEAQMQFLDAVRKLPEMRYSEVDWHAQAVITRDAARKDASELKQVAAREMAMQARRRGDESREAKNYGAALVEYRTALELWNGMPAVSELAAEMARELEAQTKLEQAQSEMQAGRFQRTQLLLDQAQALTTYEQAAINEVRSLSRRKQGMVAYGAARDLELQGLKSEALKAFEAVAADWPEGLDDEKARIDGLRVDINAAEAAFAAAEAAEQKGELAVALEHFKTARTYYAKYRDVATRIEAIEAKLAPSGSPGNGSGS